MFPIQLTFGPEFAQWVSQQPMEIGINPHQGVIRIKGAYIVDAVIELRNGDKTEKVTVRILHRMPGNNLDIVVAPESDPMYSKTHSRVVLEDGTLEFQHFPRLRETHPGIDQPITTIASPS